MIVKICEIIVETGKESHCPFAQGASIPNGFTAHTTKARHDTCAIPSGSVMIVCYFSIDV